jgi:hypothetical protein
METLVISVPDNKSIMVKNILKELGVTIKSETKDKTKTSDYAKAIKMSKEDAEKMLKDISESRGKWERDI